MMRYNTSLDFVNISALVTFGRLFLSHNVPGQGHIHVYDTDTYLVCFMFLWPHMEFGLLQTIGVVAYNGTLYSCLPKHIVT